MKHDNSVFSRTVLATAIALAFPVASALADEAQDLSNPNRSDVTFTLQNLDKVNPLFRQYSGMDRKGSTGSLDLNFVKRGDDGLWIKVQARDLNMATQEAGISFEKQGDWRIGFDYNEITKFSPYTFNTKVGGVGTDKLTLNQDWRSSLGAGPESSFKLQRDGQTLSGSKLFGDSFKVNLSLKTEDKKGAIMGGTIGSTWNLANPANPGKSYGTMFFSPQPENFRHNQIEASVDYFTQKLQLTAGVYMSMFNNQNAAGLNITPGNNAIPTLPCAATSCGTAISAATYLGGAALATQGFASGIPWISLPPDNKAREWYLSGAYNFSNTTRLSFKFSHDRATQDDTFIPAYGVVTPLAGTPISATYNAMNPPGVPYAAGIANTTLGGLIDTTSYFAMLTTKFTKDLDFLASWRYEDRDDKTPQRKYLDAQASTEYPTGATNERESHKLSRGKFELGYRLPAGFRLTAGFDYDQKKTPDTMRDEVTDKTVRVELRKSLSDTLTGKVMFAHGDRTGGEWELLDPTSFPTATNVAAPLQFADRKRDKAKVMIDWNPVDPLSLQFFLETWKDTYPFTPVGGNARMGQTEGKADLYGVDVAYRVSDSWKLNGFYSYNQNKTHQNELYTPRVLPQTCAITPAAVANTCVPWQADLDMTGEVLGFGVQGRLVGWDLGAQYLHPKDVTKYGISFNPSYPTAATSSVPAGDGVLPDTVYSLNRLKLTGVYAYSKATKLRFDYVYDVRKVDDYTWTNWTFSDGTKVNVNPNQTTHLIGLSVIQSF